MMTTIILCILMGIIFLAYHTTYVKTSTVKLTIPSVPPLTLVHLSDSHGRIRFWNGELHKLVNMTIFLAHSPNIISLIYNEDLKADLLLSGHTHGGQIRLFNRTVGAYKHFHVGQKEDQSVGVFGISRGLGTSRLPIRLNCFPEITVYMINPT